MSLPLYMDVHVDGRVTRGLISRDVDVLRSQDDGTTEMSDADLLDRATELERVIVTYDEDFLTECVMRIRAGIHFSGLIFVHPGGMTIGALIEQLQVIAECVTDLEISNQIVYVPL